LEGVREEKDGRGKGRIGLSDARWEMKGEGEMVIIR
jgi:hypothetical protein